MPTDERLREALRSREQPPPPVAQVLEVVRARRRNRSRFRRSAPLVAAIALTAAALAVVAIVGTLAGHRPRDSASGPPATTSPRDLVGTSWVLVSVGSGAGSAVPGRVTAQPITLAFHADGTFTAFDSCNSLGGRYQITGGTIDFSAGSITDMACEGSERLAAVSTAVDQALSGSAPWTIDEDHLVIGPAEGSSLTYRAG